MMILALLGRGLVGGAAWIFDIAALRILEVFEQNVYFLDSMFETIRGSFRDLVGHEGVSKTEKILSVFSRKRERRVPV